jgi:hypothetical protein
MPPTGVQFSRTRGISRACPWLLLFFITIFSGPRTARTTEPIPMVDISKRVFWCMRVPLGSVVTKKAYMGAGHPKTLNLASNCKFSFEKEHQKRENGSRHTKSYNGTLTRSRSWTFRNHRLESSHTPPSGRSRYDVISALVNRANNTPTVTDRQLVTLVTLEHYLEVEVEISESAVLETPRRLQATEIASTTLSLEWKGHGPTPQWYQTDLTCHPFCIG